MPLSQLPKNWKSDRDLMVIMGREAELHAATWKKLGLERVLAVVPDPIPIQDTADVVVARTLDDVQAFVWSVPTPFQHISIRVTDQGGIDTDTVQQFAERLEEAASDHRQVFMGLEQLGPIWAANSLRNGPWLAKSPWVQDYAGALRGVPMIVVGAGPSLGDNIQALKQAKGKAVIVAVHRALESLHRAGVTPDLTIAVECRDVKHQFVGVGLERLAAVVLSTMVDNNLQTLDTPRTIQYCSQQWEPWLLPDDEREASVAQSLGTVSHSAVSLGKVWGCDPIILVGQDLAFPNGQMYHSEGADGDARLELDDQSGNYAMKGCSDWRTHTLGEGWNKPFRCLPVPAVGGGTVLTSNEFNNFRLVFEKWAAQWNGSPRLFNASTKGAHIDGWEATDLRTALDALPDIELDVDQRFREAERAHGGQRQDREAHIMNSIQTTHDSLRRVERLITKCIRLVTRATKQPVPSNLDKLAKVEEQLRSCSSNMPLLTLATQYELKNTVNDSPKATCIEDSLRLSKRLYTHLRKESIRLQQMCRAALDDYSPQG